MKLAKKISKGIALCAALTIIGWGGVTSCSNSSSDSDEGDPTSPKEEPTSLDLSEKTITFSVTENSTNAENTMLIFQYKRSEAGAKELVKIEDCGITVKLNDKEIETISTLEFALDEYGESFSANDKDPIKNVDNMKDYKAKVSLGTKVSNGDEVVVHYDAGVCKLYGEGKDADAVKSLVVALIDTDEAVNYYKPLVADDNNYQSLFEKKEETDGAGQGNGGGTGAGSGNGDGTGNGDNKNPGGTTGGQGGGNQAGTGQGNGGGTGAGSGSGDGDNKNPGGTTGGQENSGSGDKGNGDDEINKDKPTPTPETSLELTSIIGGIQDGEDVWGSGTKTVKEADGSYTVTAAGEGEGGWGGKIAAVPVCFDAGALVGFSHIVAEVDLGEFTLKVENNEYPEIELKITDDDSDEKTKVINATKLYKDKKIEVSLADVNDDILKSATKIMFSFRGTGTLKITNIYKAKEKK